MAKEFFIIRWIKTLAKLYIDAFKYRLAKRLFIIIVIKMFILFAILKVFFFQDYLDKRFKTDQQKAQYVLDNLTAPANDNNTIDTINLQTKKIKDYGNPK